MTREEAQHILHLCRPHTTEDHDDPLIAEAMALLETDAELREWFEAQQDFDAEFSNRLAGIQPPADLESTILAGMRAHARKGRSADALVAGREDLPTTDPSWWRKPWIGIAAAAAAVLFTLFVLPRPTAVENASSQVATAGIPNLVQFLADQIDKLPSRGLDKMDNRVGELTTYLAAQAAPTPGRLPGKLEGMPPVGCVAFDYEGVKLSMICFKNGAVYHLVTVQRADLDESLPGQPQAYQLGDQSFRLWQENGKVYILSTHGNSDTLDEII